MSLETQAAAADLSQSTFSLPLRTPRTPPQTLLEVEGNTFREALELSGTPFPYFPEMIPQASGDQVIAPTPAEEKRLEKLLVENRDQKSGGVEAGLVSSGEKLDTLKEFTPAYIFPLKWRH